MNQNWQKVSLTNQTIECFQANKKSKVHSHLCYHQRIHLRESKIQNKLTKVRKAQFTLRSLLQEKCLKTERESFITTKTLAEKL